MSYLFSIIVPTFNSASTIGSCVQSLADQTFRGFEVLVMDGGSKDDTVRIAQEPRGLGDRLRVVSEPDKGVYDAMNKGILRARGEWLLFLGSDDRLYDGQVLASVAARLPLPGYDLLYGNALFQHCRQVYDGRFTIGKILFERNICHQAIFYRRSLFDRLGLYDLRYRIYADYDYNIQVFSRKDVRHKYIPLIISEYNENDGLTGRNTPDMAFHEKREEYRAAFQQTAAYRRYRLNKAKEEILQKIAFRLKRVFS
jgi:glycosyltransferase involved in cell wall biosynthesis